MRELCNALFVNGDKVKTKCFFISSNFKDCEVIYKDETYFRNVVNVNLFENRSLFSKFGIILSIYLRILYAWNAWVCVRLTQNKLKIWNNIEILMVHLWYWVDLMITESVRETVNKIVCFFFALLFYILGVSRNFSHFLLSQYLFIQQIL